jgi:hypothetical protein
MGSNPHLVRSPLRTYGFHILALLLGCALMVNVALTVLQHGNRGTTTVPQPHEYCNSVPIIQRSSDIDKAFFSVAWVAEDYPEFWDVQADPIAMTVEESVHYLIFGTEAKEEWATNSPAGFGYVRMGPDRRVFALDLFHQLHCLRLMRAALGGDYSPKTREHMGHCLNFVRQFALCDLNLTLEPPDVLDRDFEVKRTGATHVCTDWRQVFRALEDNYYSWSGNGTKST